MLRILALLSRLAYVGLTVRGVHGGGGTQHPAADHLTHLPEDYGLRLYLIPHSVSLPQSPYPQSPYLSLPTSVTLPSVTLPSVTLPQSPYLSLPTSVSLPQSPYLSLPTSVSLPQSPYLSLPHSVSLIQSPYLSLPTSVDTSVHYCTVRPRLTTHIRSPRKYPDRRGDRITGQ